MSNPKKSVMFEAETLSVSPRGLGLCLPGKEEGTRVLPGHVLDDKKQGLYIWTLGLPN